MITVINRNAVPREQIVCNSCGSTLEYGNADLEVAQTYMSGSPARYKIKCPVCGVYVIADWIKQNK